ncbi:ABC transporter ATP-binding protein [Candidatus Woesearchaeota archaeon]|nr:ABC transporter ATP-binding protein [Candidatus Woesearchaeota archaeon]
MKDIVVKGLCKSFKSRGKTITAVDDVSFYVTKGEIFGFLGANGAGKSTTINILAGLLTQDKGTVKLCGKDPYKDWEYVKNRMNVSTAYFPLSDVLTVRQNLRVYAKIYGVKDVEAKINQLLEDFELTALGDKRVNRLSSGERTRTALCKGFINDPQLLLLDECTVGLDPDIAEKTRRLIKEYQKRTNCTILFTSHYMHEVEELCDRVAFMEEGKIVTIATVDELKKRVTKHKVELTLAENGDDLKDLLKEEGLTVLAGRDNTLIFEVDVASDDVNTIVQQLVKQGLNLKDIHIKKPTLDDIFIHFARRKK